MFLAGIEPETLRITKFLEYGGVPEFLGRLRNRGHRLIARWGEEILLETSGDQKTWRSISGLEQWQWRRALESCQKWKPQTSITGNMISWNLGPLHLSVALPYIEQTIQKGAAVVLLQEELTRKGTTVKVRRELRRCSRCTNAISQREATWM